MGKTGCWCSPPRPEMILGVDVEIKASGARLGWSALLWEVREKASVAAI